MTSFAAPTRLIAIDIDGTLLPTSGFRISERNREALLRAEAEGVHIVVATGRRQAYAIPVLELAGLIAGDGHDFVQWHGDPHFQRTADRPLAASG